MPKVTDQYREARRGEIAAAALRCFGRKGFQGTSMADIIAESGLSAGEIYGHFTSKDELIEVAVRDTLARLFAEVAAVRSARPVPEPREVLRMFVNGLSGSLVDRGLLLQVWAQSTTDATLAHVAAGTVAGLKEVFAGYLTTWFADAGGMSAMEASSRGKKYAPMMLGVCQGFIVQSVLIPDFDAEEYLSALDAISPI